MKAPQEDCKRYALTVKETAQTRAFSDNQIQFMLGQKKRPKGEPVDVLMMTYGNYCRIVYGTIETDLKEAVPVANSKLGQYTVMLDVGM